MAASDALAKAIAKSQAQVAAKAKTDAKKVTKPPQPVTTGVRGRPKQTPQPTQENHGLSTTQPVKHPSPNPADKASKKEKKDKTDLSETKNAVSLETQAYWRIFQFAEQPAEIMALVGPKLPDIMDAMLEGAAKAGTAGAADRTTLGKILGATWARPADVQKALADVGHGALGDRLGKALSRREASLRHDPVTGAGPASKIVASVTAYLDHAPVMAEQVRSPKGGDEAPRGGKVVESQEAEDDDEVTRVLGKW